MTAAVLLAIVTVAWFSLRYAWWRPAVDYRFPRILMYHMISAPRAGARFNGLRVSPRKFEKQLRWLDRHGWKSFTVSELVEQAAELPEKAFAITFDDGYADNLLNALPLLEKYRCKATLYLVVERFDRDWSVLRKAHHNEGELKQERKLTDAQVQQLIDSGYVELGSHSMTHAHFPDLGTEELRHELMDSRTQLQQRFSRPVNSFAFPFGLYRPEQLAAVSEAGYASAVTTSEGIDDPAHWRPLQLQRIKVSGKDSQLAFVMRMRSGRRGW